MDIKKKTKKKREDMKAQMCTGDLERQRNLRGLLDRILGFTMLKITTKPKKIPMCPSVKNEQ